MKSILAIVFGCALVGAIHGQSLPRETVTKVKESAAYIRVTRTFSLSGEEIITSGSGFFISSRGHIVTNYHVVEPTVNIMDLAFPAPVDKIQIFRNSGSKRYKVYEGSVLIADKENDLAVLATNAANTPHLELGGEEELFETTPVWVFGFPFGDVFTVLQKGPEITVSRGTVSSLRHDDRGKLTSIQIDAAINPGNSGGPVIDMQGRVVGVMRKIMDESKLTFAVPSVYLRKLIKDSPAASVKSASLTVLSALNNADLYIGGRRISRAPVENLRVKAGWQVLAVSKLGYESWMSERMIVGDHRVSVDLQPHNDMLLATHDGSGWLSTRDCIRKGFSSVGDLLDGSRTIALRENFDSARRFALWDQSTGAEGKRTWFLSDGKAHQYEDDDELHALFLGDTSWSDYVVQTTVSMRESFKDNRAGLIFRESSKGFYLLRIHQGLDEAQLAYHNRRPFGWFIIRKQKLGRDIRSDPHTLTVKVSGDSIVAFVDQQCVFTAPAGHATRGRVGLYSVDGKSAFDSMLVVRTTGSAPRPASKSNAGPDMLSFWFLDNFNLQSTWWYQHVKGNPKPAPWQFSDGGCAQPVRDNQTRISEMMKYRFADFSMDLLISIGEGNDSALLAFVFRKNGNNYCKIEFSKQTNSASVYTVVRGRKTLLRKGELPPDFFNSTDRILLSIRKHTMFLRTSEKILVQFRDRDLPLFAGRIGFETTHMRTILHQMTISSEFLME